MSSYESAGQKLFSIIVATHNCGQKIRRTLDSIVSQNKELFELIVIDGNSTDGTLEHVRRYEKDLTLISEIDDGIYSAFNKGIDNATGKYLYFIGAGDSLRPGILERVRAGVQNAATPALVYGRCYFVKSGYENGSMFRSRNFIRGNLCQQGIFYHRDLFSLIGKFDVRYKIAADWVFNLKCFLSEQVTKKYLDYVIADYEEGGVSAEIRLDTHFVQDFPGMVRENFGTYSQLVCKAFLKEPDVFNYVYPQRLYLLPVYIASRFRVGRACIKFGKPYVGSVRGLLG